MFGRLQIRTSFILFEMSWCCRTISWHLSYGGSVHFILMSLTSSSYWESSSLSCCISLRRASPWSSLNSDCEKCSFRRSSRTFIQSSHTCGDRNGMLSENLYTKCPRIAKLGGATKEIVDMKILHIILTSTRDAPEPFHLMKFRSQLGTQELASRRSTWSTWRCFTM